MADTASLHASIVLRWDSTSAPTVIALALDGAGTPFIPFANDSFGAAVFATPDLALAFVSTNVTSGYIAVYDLSRNVIARVSLPNNMFVNIVQGDN
jgi:hypothetical protein